MLPTTKPVRIEAIYEQIVDTASDVLNASETVKRQIAGGCDPMTLVMFHRRLRASRGSGMAVAGVPGLSDYAKQVTGNPDYDIHAGFAAVLDAGSAVTDWIATNIPNDGSGGVVTQRFVDGDARPVLIPAADLAPLASLIDALILTLRGD